jgi:starch synthase
MFRDKNNKFYKDNDERAVFFSRGVIETVKKLGWAPDLIHCHGWMTSLVPLYIKRAYRDNPLFSDTRVVMSIYDDDFEEAWNKDSGNKIKLDGITNKDLKHYKKPTYVNVMKAAIDFSDGVIVGSETVNAELLDYINETGKPMLPYQPLDRFIDAYNIFYDKIISSQPAASE